MTSGLGWALEEFDRCAPWVEDALEHASGTYSLADVRALLAEDKLQIWPTPNAVAVTRVQDYPEKRVLNIWLAGGDLAELKQTEQRIERWARACGCDALSIYGRRGWLRALEGYEEVSVIMSKELV